MVTAVLAGVATMFLPGSSIPFIGQAGALAAAVTSFFIGLVLCLIAQIARAVFDAAEASRYGAELHYLEVTKRAAARRR